MGENHLSEDNPFKQTSEDILHRELNNNYHVLFQIEQNLQDIRNAVEANTANIEILEEALSTLTTIPTRPVRLSYSHRESKLWINNRFFIKFDGREADILSVMFFKSSGLAKNTKFQCSEVAEKLSDQSSGKTLTPKSISTAATRVKTKLDSRLNTKNLFTVDTKEFYFSKNTD